MAQKALTEEQMREIVQQFEAGKPVKQLADQYHVSKATAYNIINNYKEHGERAFTENVPADTEEPTEESIEIIGADLAPETETERAATVENVPNIVLEALIQYKGVMEDHIRDTENDIEKLRNMINAYQADIANREMDLIQLNDYILKVRGGEQE